MAFDFMDMLGNVASARLNQAMQPFTDTDTYATNRLYNAFGLQNPDQAGNVQPKSTTVVYGDDGTHEITNKYTVAPTDYSLTNRAPQAQAQPQMGPQAQQPGAGLGAGFSQYLAPQAQQPQLQAQPQPQSGEDQTAAETARLLQQQQFAQGVPSTPVQANRSLQPVIPAAQPQTAAYAGAGMFPAGAQPIATQTNTATPNYINAIQQNETGGLPNPNAAVGASGERGAMQVLPSTSQNPGYGVKPAANNTPEEMNRVGRDYYGAMKNRYGDPVLAAAAYNAGPGTMDKAIARAQAEGGHPMQYMPASTQQYAANFAQSIGYKPGQTAEQNPLIDRPYDNPAGGLHLPGQETQAQANMVNDARGDPQKLHEIAYSATTTPGVRKAALDEILDYHTTMKKTDEANAAIEKMAKGDPRATNDFVKETKRPAEEGSILKAIFYARMGLTGMAQEEQAKLLGQQLTTTTGMMDGEHYTLRMDNRGNIQRAYDATGKAVDDSTVAKLQTNYYGAKGATTEGSVGYDKNGDVIVRRTLPNGQGMTFYNATKNTDLGTTAPAGYRTTPQSAQEKAAIGVAAQIEKSMRKDNSDAARTGSTPQHSEEDIANERERIISGLPPSYGGASSRVAPTATPAEATAPAPALVEGPWKTPEANALAKRNPTAEAIASYKAQPPSASSKGGAGASALLNDVRKINPEYNEQKYKEAQIVRNDFAKLSAGSGGAQLQAVRRAVPHLDQIKSAYAALDSGNMPMVNAVLQQYGYNVGDDRVAAAQALTGLVTSEVEKAVAGGLGGVGEREALSKQLSPNMNSKQIAAVIKGWQGLIVTQADALRDQWTGHGLPEKEFNDLLSPRVKQVLDQHKKEETNTRSKW